MNEHKEALSTLIGHLNGLAHLLGTTDEAMSAEASHGLAALLGTITAPARELLKAQPMSRGIDPDVMEAYFEKFGRGIPVGPWHGEAMNRKAELEARKAIAGERGSLMAEEFPLNCPPGATI